MRKAVEFECLISHEELCRTNLEQQDLFRLHFEAGVRQIGGVNPEFDSWSPALRAPEPYGRYFLLLGTAEKPE